MARKRMIDPTIWADSRFGKLSAEAQIMFIGMFCNADDEGRLPGDALYLSSVIYPYKGFTEKQANLIRDEVLIKMKSVNLYTVDEQEYIQFTKWAQYQKVDRPSPSKYPSLDEGSTIDRVSLVPNRIEQNRTEKKRIEKNSFVLSEGQERELKEILLTWNEVYKQSLKSFRAIRSNYKYWREVYEFDEIVQAIKNSKKTWLSGKSIETFFRRKNPNGEEVDYISQSLNVQKEQNMGGVLVIR